MQLGKVRVAQQLVKAPGKYLTVEHVETAIGQSAPGVGGCGREIRAGRSSRSTRMT
jgi:hypothetical protein